jgi:hypothetical protein
VAPLVAASFWFITSNSTHLILDSVAIAVWYIACLIVPLAFHDDDTGAMLWLYHLVLVMLPITCDVTWWTSSITPSMWWYQSGGTVSINWFLLEEQPNFNTVFESVLKSLIPGVIIFVVTLYAKRKGWEPLPSWERRLRGAPSEPPAEESRPEVQAVPDAAQAPSGESTPPTSDETTPDST